MTGLRSPANSRSSPATISVRHKWGDKVRFPPYKSEQQCVRCETVKVTRHETEGGRDIHWVEFWRDEERIECDATPPCDARLERVGP